MKPTLLVIDTTSQAGGVALSRGSELLAEYSCLASGRHTDWLLAAIERVLDDCSVRLDELDGVGVVRGPGAFTGLRVGLATAKGLAIGLDVPMVGISSLEALAAGFASAIPVCALLDARKQEVYAALFQADSFPPRPLTNERVLPPQQLLEELDGEVLFVGDGASVYRELIEAALGGRARFVPPLFNRLRMGVAAALVDQQWRAGKQQSAALLNPSYIRPSEAEIAWLKKRSTAVIRG